MQLIKEFEKKFKSKKNHNFNIGDTIRVHTKIIEGEKERIQVFTGIVIAMKGKGLSKTFSIYRNAYGCSMEKVFLLNSPRITKIEIEKKGKVKKSKLYHLRGVSGKKAKIKEQILKKQKEIKTTKDSEKITEEIVEKEQIEPKEEKKTKKDEF
jgi:large subunit ribosomal protein L19